MNNQGQQWNNAPFRKDQAFTNVRYTYKKKNQETKQTMDAEKDKSKFKNSKAGANAGKAWKISKENANELKRSANKYAVLSEKDNGSNMEDEFADKRLIVDEFIKKKLQLTTTETKDWNYDMLNYFKYQWMAMERKDELNEKDSDEDDVYENQNGTINDITTNELGILLYLDKISENPSNSTLKKLDRIMCNDTLLSSYGNAHGIFLPFMISYHSPAILAVPNVLNRKRKSFRFVNYIADKTDFLDTVKKDWELDIKGCNMFKVVKRLRYLKKSMNDLNWKNGNLFDKVVVLKQQLKEVQGRLVTDPGIKRLPKEVADNMIIEVTDEEIKRALFDIDSNKAAGPDGYTSYFFKKA
ncbi:hypothetical protein Tco_0289364 [Tanacetum coccineum]